MSWNPFDTKKEVALGLSTLTIGGLVSLVMLDYGTVAIGLKDIAALPSELHLFATATGTTLLGYILGKKSKETSE